MNEAQFAAFTGVADHFPNVPRSLANSAGIFLGPDYHFDLTRPGIAIYGGAPVAGARKPDAAGRDAGNAHPANPLCGARRNRRLRSDRETRPREPPCRRRRRLCRRDFALGVPLRRCGSRRAECAPCPDRLAARIPSSGDRPSVDGPDGIRRDGNPAAAARTGRVDRTVREKRFCSMLSPTPPARSATRCSRASGREWKDGCWSRLAQANARAPAIRDKLRVKAVDRQQWRLR